MVQAVFEFTANQEKEHAEIFYNHLKELAGEMADKLGFESGEMFKSNKGIRFMGFEFSDSDMYVKEYIFITKDINFAIHFESNEPFIDEEYEDMETILDSFVHFKQSVIGLKLHGPGRSAPPPGWAAECRRHQRCRHCPSAAPDRRICPL